MQYITSLLFFTGCLLRWVDIPSYWRWYSYINFLRYSWGALMVNQFEGDRDVEVRLGRASLVCNRIAYERPRLDNCMTGE